MKCGRSRLVEGTQRSRSGKAWFVCPCALRGHRSSKIRKGVILSRVAQWFDCHPEELLTFYQEAHTTRRPTNSHLAELTARQCMWYLLSTARLLGAFRWRDVLVNIDRPTRHALNGGISRGKVQNERGNRCRWSLEEERWRPTCQNPAFGESRVERSEVASQSPTLR